MNKVKISSGLASVLLLACLFAGWQTMLLVALLMFVFCEVEDKVNFETLNETVFLTIDNQG